MDQENIRKERAVLAEKVIRQMRRDVAGEYRYLTIAIYYLKPVPDAQVRYFCTDGEHLFYNADDVFEAFAEGKKDLPDIEIPVPAYSGTLYDGASGK